MKVVATGFEGTQVFRGKPGAQGGGEGELMSSPTRTAGPSLLPPQLQLLEAPVWS